MKASARVRVVELDGERTTRHEDRVVAEEPLEIRLAAPGVPARRLAVTMRTPGPDSEDFELAAGWLRHEGVLAGADDVDSVAYCTDVELTAEQERNVVTVLLRRSPRRDPTARYPGVTAASSACGVCGAESIEEVFAAVDWRTAPPLPLDVDLLRRLPDVMREQQRLFDRTGGLHAAALFDAAGALLVLREDVGRHNAVDKVTGARLLAGEPTTGILVTSGRIGFEIVQKAVAAGMGALVAVGAPTSLAVGLAERADLPMLGWVRGGRAVVYSGAHRLS